MKKNISIWLLIVVIVALFILLASQSANRLFHKEDPGSTQDPKTEISIREAMIYFQETLQLDGVDEGLIHLQSLTSERDGITSGETGLRRFWEAGVLRANQAHEMEVYRLLDGVITLETTIPIYQEEEKFLPTELAIDSVEAMKIALDYDPALQPGEQVSIGYNFSLQRSSEMAPNPTIIVSGRHENLQTRITVDAMLGKVTDAERQVFVGGGIIYSPDGGETWSPSHLTSRVEIMARMPGPGGDFYAVVSDEDNLRYLYKSTDGGQNWLRDAALPAEVNDKILGFDFQRDSEGGFLVATVSDLRFSSDGKSWQTLEEAPGKIQEVAAVCEANYCIWVISGAAGAFQSTDLQTWTMLAETHHRLSLSYDGQVLTAIDPETGTGYLVSVTELEPLTMPMGTLSVAGNFGRPDGTLVSAGPQGVWLDGEEVSDLSLVAIAASPVFPESQQVLASAFRGPIYRSNDAGKSWQVVCDACGGLVDGGRDGIIQLVFLSENMVAALRGGRLDWTKY